MDASTRKANLRALIARQFGGVTANAAGAMGLTKGRVSQLLSEGGQFGERAARGIEAALGLEPYALDQPASADENQGRDSARTSLLSRPAPPPEPVSLAQALEKVGMALAAAPEETRPALASNMAGWCNAGGRGPWQGLVMSLLSGTESAKRTGTND